MRIRRHKTFFETFLFLSDVTKTKIIFWQRNFSATVWTRQIFFSCTVFKTTALDFENANSNFEIIIRKNSK